jgi:hypothetical protein
MTKISDERIAKFDRGQEIFFVPENFITRPGLWVSDEFRGRIAIPLNSVPRRSASGLKPAKVLPRNMSDSEICTELLGGMEKAKANAVCPSQIWELIQAQPGGIPGKILNDGKANIFYVLGKDGALFTVFVRWDAVYSEWRVRCYHFDENGNWNQGNQVFSN